MPCQSLKFLEGQGVSRSSDTDTQCSRRIISQSSCRPQPRHIGHIHVGDWVTDAYLVHFKRALSGDQPVQRFFVCDGSYLRFKGQSVMESLSKLNACWTPGNALEIFSDKDSALIQIAAESSPQSIKWNNRPVSGQYDEQSKLVSLNIPPI